MNPSHVSLDSRSAIAYTIGCMSLRHPLAKADNSSCSILQKWTIQPTPAPARFLNHPNILEHINIIINSGGFLLLSTWIDTWDTWLMFSKTWLYSQTHLYWSLMWPSTITMPFLFLGPIYYCRSGVHLHVTINAFSDFRNKLGTDIECSKFLWAVHLEVIHLLKCNASFSW